MIQVKIQGRLGNHLFQYAFAYSLAKQHNVDFRMINWSSSMLPTIFELSTGEKSSKQIQTKFSKILGKLLDKVYSINRKTIKISHLDSFEFKDGAIYSGYYQSHYYFKAYEQDIRQKFSFRKELLLEFEHKYGDIFSERKILAVHIRRGDYLSIDLPYLGSKGLQLPIDYYRKNIKNLLDKDTLLIFTSDDIEFVKKEFGNHENYIFSKENEVMDLILLSHADKMIMSNSSFSWWAAFLNKKKDKKIIAPKNYLGFKIGKEFPEGIMYNGFDWVDVL